MAIQSMLIFISLICMAGIHVLVLVHVILILPSPQSTRQPPDLLILRLVYHVPYSS